MSTNTRLIEFARGTALLFTALLLTTVSARAQESNDVPLVISIKGPQGEAIASATVTISEEDCKCGACPEGVTCNSQCCDCRQSPCVCCIDTMNGTTGEDGTVTFKVHAGSFSARVEMRNFKTVVEENIRVTKGQANKVEVKVGAGPDLSAVQVTAAHSPQTLTVEVKDRNNRPLEDVEVRVRKLGCNCGACPSGKVCASDCCDCRGNECVCCIDTTEATTSEGLLSLDVPPGTYEVNFSRNGNSLGTLSGVVVPPKKSVKLPARVE